MPADEGTPPEAPTSVPDGDPGALDPAWPSTGSIPVPRPNLSKVPLDGNVAVYDDVGRMLIMLNSSASAVWDRCDGASTFEGIVTGLAQQHAVGAEEIRDDVWLTVRKLASLGLVSGPAG